MTKFTKLITPKALLFSYATLAFEHRRESGVLIAQTGDRENDKFPENLAFTLGLLTLNAAIIEGLLRAILTHILHNEDSTINQCIVIQQNSILDLNDNKDINLDILSRILNQKINEIEQSGGWDKLKENYGKYLEFHFSKVLNAQLCDAIETLFLLRNKIAHGTIFIQPDTTMDKSLKDFYPYQWQQKTQQASIY